MITVKELSEFRDFARTAHNNANCRYDGQNYSTHLDMVENGIDLYESLFLKRSDYLIAKAGAMGHDLIEDAQLTFNDIKAVSNRRVAQVVLAVTDVPEENRLMRHLATMGKTVKDPIAIIVKMADMRANGLYSKVNGSSMYAKYLAEYKYRKPIFQMALNWYTYCFNATALNTFWAELDEIHNGEEMNSQNSFNIVGFRKYVDTYHVSRYSDETVINDILYGIGIGFDENKYSGGDGFAEFLTKLKKQL